MVKAKTTTTPSTKINNITSLRDLQIELLHRYDTSDHILDSHQERSYIM